MKGLSLPCGVGSDGRALTDDAKDQLVKVIMLNLSFGDSANPYQDPGISSPIFDLNDKITQAVLRNWVRRVFQKLDAQGRARLADGSPKFVEEEGQLIMDIQYIDLETDEPSKLRAVYDRATGRFRPR